MKTKREEELPSSGEFEIEKNAMQTLSKPVAEEEKQLKNETQGEISLNKAKRTTSNPILMNLGILFKAKFVCCH